ncbi:MAG TPA: sugar ABC transporter ATP-binding protein [Thermomicrobiales bacterium]|nr:sugar ABC transporter ATP-binding protein [Thermomicrobiales bacterium]
MSKSFPGVQALDNVSFDVAPGEIHALVGENGAGKSTLMKILCGVHTDYGGEILLDGERLHLSGPRDAQQHGIAIIHQELNLIPELTIAENIYLGREPRTSLGTLSTKVMQRNAARLLARLDLPVAPSRQVSSLRIGEQQLVEVAKALSLDARTLILDEPTSALSKTEIDRLFAVIASLKQGGVTMIYISHKFDEIFALADRITVLRDGHHIATVDARETTESEIIRLMVGRELADLFPKDTGSLGKDVMRVEHLDLRPSATSQKRSLHDVSFTLREGEILGVAGLMGSGRTELLEAIYGVYPPHQRSGSISVNGRRHSATSPQRSIANGLAFVTEDRKSQSLIPRLSVGQNLTLSALKRVCRLGFPVPRRERAAIDSSVTSLRIKTPGTGVEVEKLSGGNQQKVVLGKCLLTQPSILLLDEPTRGIDVGAKAEIYTLMGKLVRQGTAIVMASSELPELLAMCDRILVLHEGRQAAILDHRDANQVNIMAAATGRANGHDPSADGDRPHA